MNIDPEHRTAAVIVAAGESTRLGTGQRKPLLEIAGRRVIEHTCNAFEKSPSVSEIVIVAHAEDREQLQRLAASSQALRKVVAIVPGGADRCQSVRHGVFWTSFDCALVAIHDAARPLVEPACIESAIECAARTGAALVATPVTDTLKHSDGAGRADRTVDRSELWSAQTPQVFRSSELRKLLQRAENDSFSPTDDAALYEHYVGAVPLVEGLRSNLKLTRPEDLILIETLLRARGELGEQGTQGNTGTG